VWIFDHPSKTYTRTPLVEGAAHPNVPYESAAREYREVMIGGPGEAMCVVHPNGARLFTWAVDVESPGDGE
jgi:hypothetical protein